MCPQCIRIRNQWKNSDLLRYMWYQNWSTRWRSRVFFRFLFILLQSATTWLPHLVCRSPETSDQGLSDDVRFIRLTSLMTSQSKLNLLRFSVVFLGSAHAIDHLRLQVGYEKVLIFDKKSVDFRQKNLSKSAIWIRGNSYTMSQSLVRCSTWSSLCLALKCL